MRIELAEKLLVRIMGWSPDEVQRERPLLQALANFKYDEYQQFSPGMRFIESLVRWLKQFNTNEEKKVAYQFVISELLFLSSTQISHLVSLAYPAKVMPILIKKTSSELGIEEYLVGEITTSKAFERNKRSTLFIGWSDGSKIDNLRRISEIDNEQVHSTYDISAQKAGDMLNKLKVDVPEATGFNTIFLIDDFTASGRSYCRFVDGKDEKFAGKLFKFLAWITGKSNENTQHLQNLVDKNSLTIHLLFYVATVDALTYLRESIEKWLVHFSISLEIQVSAIQEIDYKPNMNDDFIKLCAKPQYFDDSINDNHYKEGKHSNPFLGFNECGLPLILNHNTPNNSLPVLWLQDDKKFIGLFPRVTRHKE